MRYAPCWHQNLNAAGSEDPDQIVVKGEKHQEDDEDQADLLGLLHFLDADGLLQNRFQSQEGKISSVKDGDGEEVDDPEIDAQDGHEEDQAGQSLSWLVLQPIGQSGWDLRWSWRESPVRSI